ncbi:MAG: hypothetical protein HY776_04350 [Actinobacteria bacterium]|nr:hypothetical protein [Actinomycetota bacterium]
MRKFVIRLFSGLMILVILFALAGCKKKTTKTAPAPTSQQPSSTQPTTPTTGPKVYVSAGKALNDYVSDYYKLYQEKKWKEAYEMLPASYKARDSLESYTSSHEIMPISDYKVAVPQESGNAATVTAEFTISVSGQSSVWTTTWSFEKEGDKWAVVNYKALPK